MNGRGAIVTNRPLFNPTAFDKTRFEGDLPVGWEAELYRNGELLAFAQTTGSSRYVFEDVQLLYGENRISIVLYGPQGQIRTREEMINVGPDNVPPGKTWYWAGANQPGRDVFAIGQNSERPSYLPRAQAAMAAEHGIDERTSVGAIARAMLVEDERLTFVEGSVRRAIGPTLVELGAAWESGGGKAARAQLLGKFGKLNVGAEALFASNFHLEGEARRSVKDIKIRLNAPLRIGRQYISAYSDVKFRKHADSSSELEAAARLSTTIERFNLATEARYRREFLAHGPSPPGELEVALMGSGGTGNVRLRGYGTVQVLPEARLRSAELSAYWSASDTVDWEGALAYDVGAERARARIAHIRRMSSLALRITGEAASDGSVAVGVNLNFSLHPTQGFQLSRQPLAAAGAVRASVYRDRNDNGVRDASEPFEKGALVTTGRRITEKPTDDRGSVLVGGLAPYTPIAVGIDTSSLADPNLAPRKALQVVVPRPGVPAEVEIGLVGSGAIEGAVVKNGGLGFEGLKLELLDVDGEVAGTALADYDGYFLFERVPYGRYVLRVSAESAAAANIAPDLGVTTEVSEEKSVARLGPIEVVPLTRMASNE